MTEPEQSQETEQAEVPGRAIYNPPQTYQSNVLDKNDNIIHKKGEELPCDIELMILGQDNVSRIWSLDSGQTYRFPEKEAKILLERYPWLKEETDEKVKKNVPMAPHRKPTDDEAPLLARAKKEAARGRKFFLTSEGGNVQIGSSGPVGAPQQAPPEPAGIDSSVKDDVDNTGVTE